MQWQMVSMMVAAVDVRVFACNNESEKNKKKANE